MKSLRLVRKRRGFLKSKSGNTSVEFVIWMPVFLIVLGLIADAGTAYLIQASMWNTAMDCVRRMATGQYTSSQVSPNDVKTACVKTELLYGYKFATSDITPTFGATDVSIEIKLPMSKAGLFGVLAVFSGTVTSSYKLDVKATMKAET